MLLRIEASNRYMSEVERIKLINDTLYPCRYDSTGLIYVRTEDLPRGIKSIPRWVWARGLCKEISEHEVPARNNRYGIAQLYELDKVPAWAKEHISFMYGKWALFVFPECILSVPFVLLITQRCYEYHVKQSAAYGIMRERLKEVSPPIER